MNIINNLNYLNRKVSKIERAVCCLQEGGTGGTDVLFGQGVPEDAPENPNSIYFDTDTYDLYTYENGEWERELWGGYVIATVTEDPVDPPGPSSAVILLNVVDGILWYWDGEDWVDYGADFLTSADLSGYVTTASIKGGTSEFIADEMTTVHDIVHNAGFVPSYFSLTTTEPIANNLLARTITFPDNNTMRLTFNVAPNTGENANYVYVLYR